MFFFAADMQLLVFLLLVGYSFATPFESKKIFFYYYFRLFYCDKNAEVAHKIEFVLSGTSVPKRQRFKKNINGMKN